MNASHKKIMSTLKSYVRAGKLPLMLALLPFSLGKDRTGLELFRERINLSIQRTLIRRYYGKKISYDYRSRQHKDVPDNQMVWFMWLQGIEQAPKFCQANFNYLKRSFSGQVKLITADNLFDYISLPNFIIDKWQKGFISNTHFSDIIRIQLLCTYGGTWVDSTVVAKKEFILNLPEFSIPQTYGPGKNGHSIPVSNWFIHAKKGNPFLVRVRELLFYYWQENNHALDYFIFHHFLIIASREMSDYLNRVAPLDNTLPHFLMLKIRQTEMSVQELKCYLEQFQLMKFTNKLENDIERNNYQKLVKLLEEMG